MHNEKLVEFSPCPFCEHESSVDGRHNEGCIFRAMLTVCQNAYQGTPSQNANEEAKAINAVLDFVNEIKQNRAK